MKISWVLLTWNREETVRKSISHNLKNAGFPIYEIIHCDNGSTDGTRAVVDEILHPQVKIYHNENLGVSKGYARPMLLSTGTHIVITGCDRLMPDGWLHSFAEVFDKIPGTGAVSMYSQPIEKLRERLRGPVEGETINGLHVVRAQPFGARMITRDLWLKAGSYDEDLGLYAYEDLIHSERMMKVCRENSWHYFALPGKIPEHLGDEGARQFRGLDPKEYHEFKQREVKDPRKMEIVLKHREAGWPYINPYIGKYGPWKKDEK